MALVVDIETHRKQTLECRGPIEIPIDGDVVDASDEVAGQPHVDHALGVVLHWSSSGNAHAIEHEYLDTTISPLVVDCQCELIHAIYEIANVARLE